jgi:hypothetical protein
MAILLLLLVAATLVTLATTFAADARRTRTHSADAQLRQLLTAGAIAAAEQLKSGELPSAEKAIALPPDLTDRGATLTIHRAHDGDGGGTRDSATVVVNAALANRQARQTVRFARREGRWTATAAEIN